MFQLAALVLGIAAVVLAFTSAGVSWIPLAVGVGGILFLYGGVRGRRYGPVPELSPMANDMLAEYGHFYAMPFAGRDVSGAASGLALAAMGVGAFGLFKSRWFVVAACVVVYFTASWLAKRFNPTHFLTDDREKFAHQEIIDYVTSRD